jgi:N utilization substance protein B
MKRRNLRELVFKVLFANELEKGDPFKQLGYILEDQEMAGFDEDNMPVVLTGVENDYAGRLISGILQHQSDLDAVIGGYSADWGVERLGGAERNILRMGFYEMLYDEKLPPAIAINEAVDMIKKYGTPEAAKFINGILGKKAEEIKQSAASI